jgi:hypothetical protein
MKNNTLLNYLKSNIFVLYVAIFTVVFLAPNTYYVYYSFCVFKSPYREIASLGVSLIVAASIMIYTLRKNYKVAKYYSLFEVSISAYYYASTIGWDWGLIPALGFTLILPISVYHYTLEIDKNEPSKNNDENDLLKTEIAHLKKNNSELTKIANDLKKESDELSDVLYSEKKEKKKRYKNENIIIHEGDEVKSTDKTFLVPKNLITDLSERATTMPFTSEQFNNVSEEIEEEKPTPFKELTKKKVSKKEN